MSTSGEKIFQTDENISEKIFQSLSKRRRPLQHQNLPDPLLPHEPQALPDGPPDLRPEGEKIFQTKENISEKIFQIASYGYTTDDITYKWDTADPVQLAKSLNLPRFNIEKYSSSYCNVKTNTGEYSCLSVDLVFKRQFSYYLITIYVPGCMLVIVSWVNFWLDPKAVPARVALGVTTLLTMSTQTASINSALPPVAYTKGEI